VFLLNNLAIRNRTLKTQINYKMKKLVLTSACALAMTGASFAQGTVNWGSISPAGLTFETNTTVLSYLSSPTASLPASQAIGATSAVAGTYYFELLYQAGGTQATPDADPTTLTGLNAWADSGISAINSTVSAGKVLPPAANETALTVSGSTSGGSYSFMVVGWSSNLGTTWSAVSQLLNTVNPTIPVGALFGESSTAFAALGTGNPGAVLVGTAAGEIKSLLTPLEPVVSAPEPTTIALGVMGAASLLAFRRKKA
jgi:hypothetical protein